MAPRNINKIQIDRQNFEPKLRQCQNTDSVKLSEERVLFSAYSNYILSNRRFQKLDFHSHQSRESKSEARHRGCTG